MDSTDYFDGYALDPNLKVGKPIVWLDDWSIVPSNMSPYTAPEARRPVLYGRVMGHPRYEDGTYVTTSCILASAGREVETNNTVYKLGPMSKGYKDWCSSNDISVDHKQPVKVIDAP